jgi:hypothetical protein
VRLVGSVRTFGCGCSQDLGSLLAGFVGGCFGGQPGQEFGRVRWAWRGTIQIRPAVGLRFEEVLCGSTDWTRI